MIPTLPLLDSQCNVLGNNLKDLVDKYQHYEDASSGLLSGLQACEATASRHLSEPIAVDPKNLQRQLEEMKVRETRGRERSSPGVVPQETLLSPHFCDLAHRARGEGLGRCACPSSGLLTWSSDVCPFLFLLLWFSWSDTAVVVCIHHLLLPRHRPVLPGLAVVFTLTYFVHHLSPSLALRSAGLTLGLFCSLLRAGALMGPR